MTILLIVAVGIAALFPFLLLIFKKKKADIFNPIYFSSAYFFLLFVLRPIYDLTIGSKNLGFPPLSDDTTEPFQIALIYTFSSYLLFLIGFYCSIPRYLTKCSPKFPVTWKLKNYRLLFYLLLIVGIIIHGLLIQSMGGINNYILNKDETLTAGGQGYLSIGLSLINFVYAISLTNFLSNRKEKFLVFFCLIILIVLGIISGSKGQFLSPLMTTLIVLHYLKKPINPKILILGLVVVIMIFPIFNIYRQKNDLIELQESVKNFYSLLNWQDLTTQFMGRFHTFDSFVRIIKYTPGLLEFQYGATILPIFVVWIPRQLWADKPIVSFGKVFSEIYYSDLYASDSGVSASVGIIGEGYINFHILGALSVSFISGVLLRFFYQYLIKSNFGLPSIALYSSMFFLTSIFWESNLSGFISGRAIVLLTIIPLIYFMGSKNNNRIKS
jgi:oligosaccharide repeat unit polymerase